MIRPSVFLGICQRRLTSPPSTSENAAPKPHANAAIIAGRIRGWPKRWTRGSMRTSKPYPHDPNGIITGGHDNETARTVAIREGEAINRPALVAMVRQIIANNRAGGW